MTTYSIKKTTRKGSIILLAAALSFLSLTTKEVVSQESPTKLIFIDSFERGKFENRWEISKDKSMLVKINYDPRNVHRGGASMEITALPGEDAGTMPRIWFRPGFDKVHVRWYCKFDADFDQGNLMHLNKLVAGIDRGSGYGTAGQRPTGFDFFRTTLDIWRDWGRNPPPGEPVFYSYFPLMKIDNKTGKYWGNLFKAKKKILIKRGRWYCMEMMLKANFAGLNNGEQAFWINGKLIGFFRNIVWCYTNDLKINSFDMGLYIHHNKKINRIWYDDVVISTGYIGI